MAVPKGWVSGDGIALSQEFARGTWFWNPNHLLLEPIGAWWQATLTDLGIGPSGPDRLKILSIICGAVATGLFRWLIGGRLADQRLGANHATAWFALGAGYLTLWVSDETHMLQMPAVVAFGGAVLAHLERPTFRRALLLGAAAGVAALVYISNVLLALAAVGVLGAARARRGAWGRAGATATGVAAGGVLVAGTALLAAWMVAAPPEVGLIAWLTSYAGGHGSARVAESYGMTLTPAGVVEAVARAAYGAANVVVDVSPVVEALRDGTPLGIVGLLNAAALAAAAALLVGGLAVAWKGRRAPRIRAALLLVTTLVLAVGAFGIYWNNSDDQFFFQLAVVFGTLAALVPVSGARGRAPWRWLVAGGLLALAWNVQDFVHRRLLYPRAELVALLTRATAGAGLVIYPGTEEIDHLLFFAPAPTRGNRLTITSLASRFPPDSGLAILRARVAGTLARGERVDVLDVLDGPPQRHPWKALREMGYDRAAVAAVLREFSLDSVPQRLGPFALRSVRRPPPPPA